MEDKKGIFFYLFLTFFIMFCLLPIIWLLITSLKPELEIANIPPLLPRNMVFDHYPAVFHGRPFLKYLLNSFAVSGATTIFCLIVGSFAAYALAKLNFRGKKFVLALVLMVSMFPQIAIVSPLYKIINTFGIRDTWISLIFPYTTFAMPLTIYVLNNFFKEIPDELGRSARIDGCSPFQAFFKIILPLALPGMVTTGILVFIQAWNEFLFALTFTATERARTVPVGIALFPGLKDIPWGDIAAASIIVTVPIIILILIFQKQIVSGLTSGAVKG